MQFWSSSLMSLMSLLLPGWANDCLGAESLYRGYAVSVKTAAVLGGFLRSAVSQDGINVRP